MIVEVSYGDGDFPYRGEVVWLTPEQGGRKGGPPTTQAGYATVAHIPPADPACGCASFVLRGWDPASLRSDAEGRWLLGELVPQYWEVRKGTVIVVTEGVRTVAIFTVRQVRRSDSTDRP